MQSGLEGWMKRHAKALYLRGRSAALHTLGHALPDRKPVQTRPGMHNVLFIRVDRVGDMVLSTPAFGAIKAKWPAARLAVLASPANAPVLGNNPHVDEVIVYDRTASLADKIRLLRGLQGHCFDLAIDPRDDYELETAWIAWMSGAASRMGYAAFGREVFLSGPLLTYKGEQHFIDLSLDILKTLDVPVHNRQPFIYLTEEEQEWASLWLQKNGLQDGNVVAIHPGAYYETQRWPPEHYAELIRLLQDRAQAEVVLLAGDSDAEVVENILNRLCRSVCVAVQSDLRRFLALLSKCTMLVCNNSGPLHCAEALRVPTVSFMGPTVKERWSPSGQMHHVLRRNELPCIGCNLGRCKIRTHDCMRLIFPETVLDLIIADRLCL